MTNDIIKNILSTSSVDIFSVCHDDVNDKQVVDKIKKVSVSDLTEQLNKRECFESHVINYFQQDVNKKFLSQKDVDILTDIKKQTHHQIQFDDVGDYIIVIK